MPWYTTDDARRDVARLGHHELAKVGDMLTPIREWNASEGNWANRLPVQVKVEDVIPARSESGVLYRVKTLGGRYRNLDAAWFERRLDSSME